MDEKRRKMDTAIFSEKKELLPAEFVEQGKTDTKEQDCRNRPDRPGDSPITVDINADKKDTDHDHDGNLVPPFLLAFSLHGFFHHTHNIR